MYCSRGTSAPQRHTCDPTRPGWLRSCTRRNSCRACLARDTSTVELEGESDIIVAARKSRGLDEGRNAIVVKYAVRLVLPSRTLLGVSLRACSYTSSDEESDESDGSDSSGRGARGTRTEGSSVMSSSAGSLPRSSSKARSCSMRCASGCVPLPSSHVMRASSSSFLTQRLNTPYKRSA